MQQFRPHLQIARTGATWLALVWLIWVGAGWFWRALSPAPAVPARVPVDADWAAKVGVEPLFGIAPAPEFAAAGPATAAPRPQADLRLVGLLATRDLAHSMALLGVASQPARWVGVGKEVQPGVVLERVFPNGAVISDNGVRTVLRLRDTRAGVVPETAKLPVPPAGGPSTNAPVAGAPVSATVAKGAAGTLAASGTRPGCTSPVGGLPTYLLRAELLEGAARDPAQWQNMFAAQDNGLIVRDSTGVGRLLGLQPGDRLEAANGAILRRTDDIVRLILNALRRSEMVTVTGHRGGQKAGWVYINASAC